MFLKIKNHYIFLLLLFILTGCQLQNPDKTHGIVFLENRANKLIVNKSNKNDIINIIGQPHLKNDAENNSWIYLERTLSKGKIFKLGQHVLKDNNVLVLDFDKYGILRNKEFLTKNDIKKIKFIDKTTENDLSKKSFVQSFLESIRQKAMPLP